jgi:hypothetical protein
VDTLEERIKHATELAERLETLKGDASKSAKELETLKDGAAKSAEDLERLKADATISSKELDIKVRAETVDARAPLAPRARRAGRGSRANALALTLPCDSPPWPTRARGTDFGGETRSARCRPDPAEQCCRGGSLRRRCRRRHDASHVMCDRLIHVMPPA